MDDTQRHDIIQHSPSFTTSISALAKKKNIFKIFHQMGQKKKNYSKKFSELCTSKFREKFTDYNGIVHF